MLEIKVKLKEGVQQEFEFIEGKSNWIDLRTAERTNETRRFQTHTIRIRIRAT